MYMYMALGKNGIQINIFFIVQENTKWGLIRSVFAWHV